MPSCFKIPLRLVGAGWTQECEESGENRETFAYLGTIGFCTDFD